jgi:tetratricopeptide (TPR) repeat protein/transglutaminase-like putative cysteine protease
MRFRFLPLFVVILVCFLNSKLEPQEAAATLTPWEAPAFSSSPKDIAEAAKAIKPQQYATVTIFNEESRLTFDSSERTVQTHRLVYRVEAKDALVSWGTVHATWSPWRQKRPAIRARVIAPDGSVAELDPKVLTEAPVHDQRPQLYEDQRSYSGPLPGVVVGSIIETEIIWEDTAPVSTHGVTRRFYVGYSNPTQHTLLELKAPASIHLRYKVRNAPLVKATSSEQDGMTVLRFEQGPMAALEGTEPDQPSDSEVSPSIDYATGESWLSVADGYYRDIENTIRPREVTSLLEGTQGLKGTELLRRLVSNLHQKVRYTGLEFGSSALIPHPAGETLKSGYGDCKDKAIVLISALRAAGVPAALALLNVRGSDDVNPEVPGLGKFDHAIVYIPGKPETWIDATAEFFGPGDLPWADQGRRALIVEPGTKELLQIPINAPDKNALNVRREFHLAEYGPARISETLGATGREEASLRSGYGQEESKESHDGLESYVKNVLLADALTKTEHTSGTDLTTPFQLKLAVAKGRRGLSDFTQAVVAIRSDGLLWGYPNYVLSDDGTDKPDQTGWRPRKQDIEIQPFATDWRYMIVPPPGFDDPVLPKDAERSLGPAKLTQHYQLEKDGTVSAVWHFDSGKARYTPAELKALRQAVHAFYNSDVPTVTFHQKAAALLAQGKAREALKSYSDLIQLHPNEGLHHVQMANALLSAGFGEEARKEARRATELDPKDSVSWGALGWILEHDAIGRRFGKGFDLDGGIAAYRKSIGLDPKEWSNYADLAILLEHDSFGERYSSASRLDEALAEYRALKTANKEHGERWDDNQLFVLFYARKWDELLQMAATLSSTSTRTSLVLAAIAIRDGSQPALSEAGRRESGESARSALLVSAADLLIRVRAYARAVDLLNAAVAGQEDSSKLRGRIEMMSGVRPYEEVLFQASDPRRVVQQFYLYLLDERAKPGDMFRLTESDPADQKDEGERASHSARLVRSAFDQEGLSPATARDYLVSNLQISMEGDDKTGYRIRARGLGDKPQTMLVVRGPDGYRIVAMDSDAAMAGKEVLRRLSAGDLKNAKLWLDWVREQQTLTSGDDPLGGAAFPRFWTRGDDANAARMRLAALALLVDSSAIAAYIEELKSDRAQATPADQTRLDLLLAQAASKTKNWPLLHEAALRLFASVPTSDTALQLVATASMFTHDWNGWQKTISSRLTRLPDDRAAIRSSAALAEGQGDFAKARSILRPLIDKNQAEMNDFNQYTWDALFLGKVTNEDVALLQRAITEQHDSSFAEIHTLACLYAEISKTKEARELLLRAMDSGGMDEPNEPIWFGFGRIAEEYGLLQGALSLYRRVGNTEGAELASSTYNLARLREKQLNLIANVPASSGK